MAEGNDTYKGLAVPLYGQSEIIQQTLGEDIITLTGASSQTGDFLVCQSSAGAEKFVADKDGNVELGGKVSKMVLGTVALGSLASDASATVALSGITTDHVVGIFNRAAQTTSGFPVVWPADTNKLGYGAAGKACASLTVSVWFFATA
jgi:hypothetical protein